MTEQRFDIAVQDKVARTIKTELAAIGTTARTTQGFLRSMKAEMTSLSGGAGGLGSTVSATTRAFREEAAAANAARAALAAQRAEVDALTRSLQAQANAARAAGSARSGAGTSATGAAGGIRGAGLGAARTSASTSANAARSVREVGEAAKLSSQYTAQLGFQLNDIFVSLASGQKPMTVFIQQGAQISQIPAQAGMSWKQFATAAANTLGVVKRTGDAALDAAAAQAAAAASAIAAANSSAAANVRVAETEVALATAQQAAASTATEQAAASARLTAANQALAATNAEAAVTASALATANEAVALSATEAAAAESVALAPLTVVLLAAAAATAALTIGLAALKSEANDASGLKTYTKEMGFTAAEIKKLNSVTVSFGDTAKAVFQVGWQRIASAFGLSNADIKKAWKATMDFLVSAVRVTIASIYASMTALGYVIARVIENTKKGTFENPINTMIESTKTAYKDANKFMDDVVAKARANARARQDQMASEMVDPKNGKKGWDRAQNLKNDNLELDQQIKLLALYGDELERANMLEQISKKYRDHNVPLTQAETAALEAKIKALQEGKRVQEEMTAIDEAANGASRKYEASLSALDQMLANGKINQEQYNEQLRLITRAFDEATDPLAALNRELQRSGELMGLYGRDRDVAAYIQQLQQAAEAQGKTIFEGSGTTVGPNGTIVVSGSKRLNSQAQGMVDQFRQQQQQQDYGQYFQRNDSQQKYQDPNSDTYVLDHYKELYAEIERLRQEDVISEADAQQRKKDLDRDYADTRLETTSSMLGQLAGLQSSHNRTIAALGKAAAIAQATIDGYRAVQAALIGPPGPPWSFAIAGVTAAMTAANVAKIAGIGFMSGGYTGDMATNQVAGAVHGQEFVFDAAATKRIGVPALEAMRKSGSLSMPGNDNGRSGSSIRIVQGPGTYVEAVERSDGEIEIIAERVARRVAPSAVADDIHRSPNSKTAHALKSNYSLTRNR